MGCKLALWPHGVTYAEASACALPGYNHGQWQGHEKMEMQVECCVFGDCDNLGNHRRKSHLGPTWLLTAFTDRFPTRTFKEPLRNACLLASLYECQDYGPHLTFTCGLPELFLVSLDTPGCKHKALCHFLAWRSLQRAGG